MPEGIRSLYRDSSVLRINPHTSGRRNRSPTRSSDELNRHISVNADCIPKIREKQSQYRHGIVA